MAKSPSRPSRITHWTFASGRLLLTAVLVLLALRMVTFMTTPDARVGLTGAGHLSPCPTSPNCVATYGEHSDRRLDPLHFEVAADEAMRQLVELVGELPRTRVVTQQAHYLHVEFRSRLFRFVDDVEFLMMPAEGTIQFRSASRVGYSDLGANRRRMEKIQELWERSRKGA
jgi:uncharacterized protein (DUF1499 family)